VVEKIKQADADVVCLMEVFDYDAVTCLLKRLKKDYAYFYFNIGPKAIGVSSGFFIASNIAIEDPEFVRFPKEHLIGRTKNAAKGLFSFILGNKISILLTHLQHSEECEFPTKEEVVARNHQMNMVMQFAESKTIPVIITGDLNLDEEEFNNTHWSKDVNRGVIPLEKTWRGDEFVARLMNKKPSRALTYDYTMSFNDDNVNIKTSYVETGYDPRVFKREALSDHLGLLSVISFK
jgi:endonuclease/exonuclease/phosphatase family metal-dependent hydrolase